MALREKYLEHDTGVLWETIEANPFGTVIGISARDPRVAHVPFRLQRAGGTLGTLQGHVATTNPIAADLSGRLLVVFGGPHAYISPRWYSDANRVPTWNYVAVHVRGRGRLVTSEAHQDKLMDELVASFEPGSEGWKRSRLSEEQYRSRLKAIQPFELEIEELEGVFKLSQDKGVTDQLAVVAGLEREANQPALIERMKRRQK
ncbi:MAG: FMN-binding negative transcriptional regulator [Pseudomonadota bacterium]